MSADENNFSTKWCHICDDRDGAKPTAEYFCLTCKQCLCSECRDIHRIITTTKSHDVLSLIELPISVIDNLATGKDETLETTSKLPCDICKERGQHKTAEYLCVTCEQYQCDDCKDYHMKAKATRQHEVFILPLVKTTNIDGIDNTAHSTGDLAEADTLMIRNCNEHNSPFKYICETHKYVLCDTCKQAEHANCEHVVELEEQFKHFTKDWKIDGSMSLEEWLPGLDEILQEARDQRDKIKVMEHQLRAEKQSLIGKLKKLRYNVDSLLDKLEAQATAEIDIPFDAKLKQMSDAGTELDSMITLLTDGVKKRMALRHLDGGDKALSALIIYCTITKEMNKLAEETQKISSVLGPDNDETQQSYINDFEKCTNAMRKISEINVLATLAIGDRGSITLNGSIDIKAEEGKKLPGIKSNAELEGARETVFNILEAGLDYGLTFHTFSLSDPGF